MSRHDQLRRLIDEFDAGNQADFARRIGRTPAVVWQYLSGHREMGEKLARHIEQRLRLPHGWMDQPHPPAPAPGEVIRPRLAGPERTAEPTLTDHLDSIAARLAQADPAVREAVGRLVLRYLDSPKSGAKIARAIEQLLTEDDLSDPAA